MADSVELVTAYINLVPSMQGAESSITDQLVGAATTGGEGAGAAAAAGFGTKWKAGIAGLAAVAGGAALFRGLWDIADTFDEVEDTIRTGTGATGEALDSLVASAQNVGNTVPAEFSAVGTTVADLNTRLGLTGGTLETVASQYLEAGRILGQEVDIQSTTAAFNAFGIEGENVAGAMDTLFQVSQATGVGMNELASSVQANAPAVQALGFSFEETAALVGSLDKAGLNSTQVMSAMSRGLVNLAKDGEEPAEAFARVVDEIGGYIEAGDTAAAIDLAGEVFGTRGATQLVGAIESGTLALDDLVATAGLTGDTILGVGAETQDFAETWQIVKNNAMSALEPLATSIFQGIGDAAAAAMPYLQSFGAWLAENQWVLGVVAGVIGVTLVAAFFAWAASIWATTAALLANPITWIVIGIMALIAGLVLLIANWDKVATWLGTVWGAVVEWVKTTFASIGEWFTTKGEQIWSFLTGLWERVRTTAVEKWTALVEWIKGVPGRVVGALSALGTTLVSNVATWIGNVRQSAIDKFNSLVTWVKGLPGKILGALGDMGKLLWNAGSQIITGFLDGLKSGWTSVTSWVGGIGDWIAANKGPKAYDLALLVPAGRWIMQGLQAGLESEKPSLRRTLAGVSATIAGTRFAGPSVGAGVGVGAGGGGAQVQQNIYPTPGMSEEQIGYAAARGLAWEMA